MLSLSFFSPGTSSHKPKDNIFIVASLFNRLLQSLNLFSLPLNQVKVFKNVFFYLNI